MAYLCMMKQRTHFKFFILYIMLLAPLELFAQSKVSLKDFLDRIQNQNLDIKVESAKADAAKSRAIGVKIPEPMVGAIQMTDQSGSTTRGFEISQTVPFPTKVTADLNARDYEAKSQNEMSLAERNEILARAKNVYLALWAAQEKSSLLLEKKKIIKGHISLSRSTARSDSFAAVHVIKAEYDFDYLDNEIAEIDQALRSQQIEAAILLNADVNTFKLVTTEPEISSVPKIESVDSSPQLQAQKFNLESLRSKEFAAKSMWLPDFNFRYRQLEQSSMLPRYNELMVNITLPFVYFWQPYSESSAATSERLSAEYQLQKQERALTGTRAILLSKAESLKKQLDNVRQNLIPKAERRMKLVQNLAPRDIETLQDHREAMEAFPDLKLKAVDLRLEYERTVFELEKYHRGTNEKN
ncbi:MAG: hypothetical protein A4S09_06325 [Proteobacteria bacterium SG_bin7]|nr:MAG: hypothetical protein A4S09_06325 [Proteobacteria bacterium SG_bin7]